MNQSISLPLRLSRKISFAHAAAFLITLPFDFFYNELVLLSFLLHTLIHTSPGAWRKLANKNGWIITSFYLLGWLALSYSPDKAEGIRILTRQSAFLVFPLLVVLSDLDWEASRIPLLRIFAFTCSFTVLYLYLDALYTIHYFKLPLSSLFSLAFMNHNFSQPIDIHATYLSMYVAFSIVIFISLLLSEPGKTRRRIYVIAIIILSAGLLQLSSRAVFIALLLILNTCIPFLLLKGRQRIRFFLVTLLLSGAALFVIFTIDAFKIRYINELQKDLAEKSSLVEINEPRMARWELIAGLIKKSPLIGYGTGAEKQLLQDQYFEHKLYSSFINEFNTHSEYLSFLLKTGIIGLLLYLFVLFWGMREALRRKDLLFSSFLVMILVVGVSENVLDLNKGIFFISFFFSFFLLPGSAALPNLRSRQPN